MFAGGFLNHVISVFFIMSYALVGVIGLDLFLGEFLLVDGAPGVDDVGEHEGHEQGYPEHRVERELAGAGVL